ncbi:winged helix-turn-helix transcriptional regulator [Sphingomonas sp. DT-51]|uniref:winged helix-turn-helix transcriptional regulator n=1 Tax=Sphingomonas sp. DT-51 TaxID=3396165 RepID=UPI003F1B4F23
MSPHDAASPRCAEISRHLSWIGDRWTLPVLVALQPGALRFNELRRAVPTISQQMLTRTLRNLQRDGLVERHVEPTTPPRVSYTLTSMGHSLADEGHGIGQWVDRHMSQLAASRAAFDVDLAEAQRSER